MNRPDPYLRIPAVRPGRAAFFVVFVRRSVRAVLMLAFLFAAGTWTGGGLRAQDGATWDEFAAQYAFDAAASGLGESAVDDQLEQLYMMHLAPMDLNRADAASLARLPFLDDATADSLVAYRERVGGYYSLGELQLVPRLDYRTRRWLALFVYCGSPETKRPPLARRLVAGRWDVSGLLGVPLYRRAGQRSHSAEELDRYPNRQYVGDALNHSLRLTYSYGDEVNYGLKLDKDAGEPFASHGNYPYDEWAYYVRFRPGRRCQDLIAGNFRVDVGEGLLLGNRFLVDKAAAVTTFRPPSARLSPTLSTSGSQLFQGVATTWSLRRWRLTVFGSWRRMDANLDDEGRVTSLKTDGYHRTPLERTKRRNLGAGAGGAAVEYVRPDWRVGLAAAGVAYDRTFCPRDALYSRYYFRGRWTGGASAYFGGRWGRWTARGEAATDKDGHVALAGTATCRLLPDWTLGVEGRKLPVRFASPAGQTLQEGSRTANEEGVLVGSSFRLPGGVEATVYADWFRFPWATYRASQPSKGMELSGEFAWQQGRSRTWTLRYRMKTKQRDVAGYDDLMEFVTTHRLRMAVAGGAQRWQWTAAVDGAIERRQTGAVSRGIMGSGRVTWRPDRWRLAAMGAFFFTDDYATALSAYQPSFADSYGFLRCYYHGAAGALLAQWEPVRRWAIGVRASLTGYFNRSTISSGTQQIDAPVKADLLFRLAYRF